MQAELIDKMGNDLAWAAGIIEGEGTITFNKIKNRANSYRTSIAVTMSDEDVVRRLCYVLGEGTVNGPYKKPNRKPLYTWAVQNQKGCFDVLLKVGNMFGARRKEKAAEMFEFLEERVCK